MISKKNQQNPPLPKKKRVDSLGNDARRVFIKTGTASLEFAKMPTENAAKVLIQSTIDNIKKLGGTYSHQMFIAR